MQFIIELIKNKDLSSDKLNQIITLKSQFWKYSSEDQFKWIKKNINDNDYHLLLFSNSNELIGYLNIVNLKVKSGLSTVSYLGVGNVCISKEYGGRGYGTLIMNIVNSIIKQIGYPGILLCNASLNEFYIKAGWVLYNGRSYIDKNVYESSVFTTDNLLSLEIYIEKNF